MIKSLLPLILICTSLNSLYAKDYGVHGNLFEIHETSLLDYIINQIKKAQADGSLDRKIQAKIKEISRRAGIPDKVEGINPTVEEKITYFDPSITVEKDLKDHRGVIFQQKGKRINPLDEFSWGDPLVFLDGDDPQHQAYAQKSQNEKIVLVSGKPLVLEKAFGKSIYFDQHGKLSEKFGIKHVPCRVSQDSKRLKVHEFLIKTKR